jgi:hypothetical protein
MSDGILTFAKMVIDQGVAPGLDCNDFHKAIEKRAEKIRKAGETAEGAYTRFITSDPDGKLLFKAYRAAPKPAMPFSSAAPADEDQDYVPRGPADKAMRSLIERHQLQAAKDGKPLSYAQAFTRVYEEAANRELKAEWDAEQAETTAKRAAGLK